SHNYFQMTNVVPDFIDEGIGGLTESNKKRILVPYSGSYDELRHTLTHEIVHAFQYDILSGNDVGEYVGIQSQFSTPLWLVEGMAEYYSIGWDSRSDMIMRDAVLSDTLPSIMNLNNYQVINPMMFYKGGQSVLQYIALTYGEKKIPELLRDSRDQKNINDAVKTNFGVTLEEFNRGWFLWLKRLYFKDVEKRSISESGRFGTSHLDDKSIINLYPSISPDGKNIAYVTIRNFNPVIVIRNIENDILSRNYEIRENKKNREKIVVRAGDSEQFYQLHLMDNNISFTSDSKNIFFSARSYGKDVLYLFDFERKKVIQSWKMDFDMIQFPSLSSDDHFAVFAGTRKSKTDLYILDLKTQKIEQLTDDYFSEKDPVFSKDGKMIYYSANDSDDANIENQNYNIFEMEINSKKIKQIVSLNGKQEKPQIFNNDKTPSILFISDHEGSINVYSCTLSTGKIDKITNSFHGILSMKSDENEDKYVMAVYREQGYDIALFNKKDFEQEVLKNKQSSGTKYDDLNEGLSSGINFFLPLFPNSSYFLTDIKSKAYVPRFSLDVVYFGLAYSNYSGFGGFAFFSMSEYMGDHRIQGMVDFITQSGGFNFYTDYSLLKYRLNWHAGLFRTSSYYNILNLMDLASLNNLIYDPNQFTQSLYKFGGYVKAVYPWTNFLKNDLGIEISRYEEKFYEYFSYNRPDIATNIFAVSSSLVFNNTLYSYYGPLKGTYLGITDRQTLNITGKDYVYNSIVLDFRQYFNFFERYVFAIRLMGGAVSGSQKEYFPYRIGGPFTMRGYDFLSLQGIYTALLNLEFRFPMIDYIVMGFPVQWAIRGFTAVAFLDAGSAFNDFTRWKLYDEQNKSLSDLKLSSGFGIRVLLVPGILLRFDWAVPWDLKNNYPLKFNFSLGYEY
ncbi:MAG: DPP IV N-terminal domain-containing protein, partial [Spirochaetia bacterium]|nr:DPP IV N-terminal domain-containing protein [Spirochaetia bacterium]